MKYQSVLVLHTPQDSIESLESAVLWANKWNAQIDICVLSLPVSTKRIATVKGVDGIREKGARADLASTEDRLERIRRFTNEHKIAVSLTNHYTIEDNIQELLTKSSLYADLVMISHGSSLQSGFHRKCLDAALFEANKPVLLAANQSLNVTKENITKEKATKELEQPKAFEHVVIAWHEDIHSIQAIRAAFPLLEMAKKIDLVQIENEISTTADKRDNSHKVSDIEAYLARHGLTASLAIVGTDGRFVSHALLDTIGQLNPDLVVMGAFGHSRIAEKLFHGVTYDVLANLNHTDLFLSHA